MNWVGPNMLLYPGGASVVEPKSGDTAPFGTLKYGNTAWLIRIKSSFSFMGTVGLRDTSKPDASPTGLGFVQIKSCADIGMNIKFASGSTNFSDNSSSDCFFVH